MIQRTLGETVAISVATAQIFELTLTDELTNKPDGVMFNVRTLWRNYWEAWSEADRPNVRLILDGFFEELDIIAGLMQQLEISAFYFWPEYRALKKKLPGAVLKEKKTASAIIAETAERALEPLLKRSGQAIFIDTLIPKANGNAWLVSHLPIDLLSRYQFTSLKLLESHTGALVDPMSWNKKIFSNQKYRRMPFNHFTLSIFGDRSKMFAGHPMKVRKAIAQLAETAKWTPMTSIEKIRFDLDKLEDPEIKTIAKSALTVNLR